MSDLPILYLTFDDGPHPEHTPRILDHLSARSATATFFQIGRHVDEHPEVTLRASREGHTIGNHTYNHTLYGPDSYLPDQHEAEIRSEIAMASNAVERVIAERPTLFRPPWGKQEGSTTRAAFHRIVADLGLSLVLWTVDSGDYRPGVTRHDIGSRVLANHLEEGAVILMHDDRAETVPALAALLAELSERFSFKALPPEFSLH